MKTAAVIALVLLVVLTGLPIGMAMGACPASCHGTDPSDGGMALGLCSAAGSCVAVFAVFTLIVAFFLGLARPRDRRALSLLLARSVEHPPRV